MQAILRNSSTVPGVGTDKVRTFLPRGWKGDGTKPGLLIAMGTGDGFQRTYDTPILTFAEAVTAAGYPVIVSELGSPHGIGNDTAQVNATVLLDHLYGTVEAKPNKAILLGFSMGGVLALGYAGRYPGKVAGALGVQPLCDINAEPTVEKDAAYPPAYSDTAHGPTHNPQKIASVAGAYAGVAVKILYSTDDPAIPLSHMQAFTTAAGVAAPVSIGAQGHSSNVFAVPAVATHAIAMLAAA